MRRLATTLVMLASLFTIGSARASTEVPSADQMKRMVKATVVVPVEWDGIYTTVDTTYDCNGVFQSTVTTTDGDTICGGKDYSPNSGGSPIVFDCTGTADASSFSMTCTGSGEIFTGCTADFTIVIHGTLSGGTYFDVSTINVTYSGSSCSGFPPTCNQFNSHGTRTGPAPTAYCATPTRRTTWGQVKMYYR